MDKENQSPPSRKKKILTITWSVLLVIIVSLLLAPATHMPSTKSRGKAVVNNLRQIAAAGQQYILEEDKAQVSYDELVGDYFSAISSVEGETYEQLIVYRDGGALRVTTERGERVTFTY